MSTFPILQFSDRQIQGNYFHITSIDWARNRLLGYHGHDYPEIFWINRGRCAHRINGEVQHLGEGDLVLMRSTDCHEMRPMDRSGFGFTNLSISPEIFSELITRFDTPLDRLYPKESNVPRLIRLGARNLDAVRRDARILAEAPHLRFYLEHFLVNLWAKCIPKELLHPSPEDLPDWLQEACVRVQEPEFFCEGVPAFVRLCGRSHEHVARECRKVLKKTPTMIVNDARLARASNDLRTTSRSVSEIALDCGFEDPGTFFRLFKNQFGTTPKTYRCAF